MEFGNLQILLDASNGASDYGNKFGEPLIAGYTRSFGARMPSGERREWIKPIMFRCPSLMARTLNFFVFNTPYLASLHPASMALPHPLFSAFGSLQ
jgi:hypothetical protein